MLALRMIFCPQSHKYLFKLRIIGRPQKFKLDQTAEVIEAVIQNLKQN
jgi:hypothetical protein